MAKLSCVAVSACLIADLAWYVAGRSFGGRVVHTVCRISLSPDSCMRRTSDLFARWGPGSLLVAKFIPGFGAIATALSGNTRMPLGTFMVFDAIGATLYTGLDIGLGRVFHDTIGSVVVVLAELGFGALVAIASVQLALIVFKVGQQKSSLR